MVPLVTPFLGPLVSKTPGLRHLAHLYAEIRTGKMQLWVGEQNGHVLGAVVTQIARLPCEDVCLIVLLAGSGLWSWKHLITDIEEWARAQGCTRIRIEGRKGWGRLYPDYEEEYTVFGKELSHG